MERAIELALNIWHRFTFTRYLMASIFALAFDVATFSTLVLVKTNPALASAIGYSVGVGVHWLVSTQFVFTGKVRNGVALHVQRVMFVATALIGLAITVSTVLFLSGIGIHLLLAKAVAVILSFIAVYASRKWGVFR